MGSLLAGLDNQTINFVYSVARDVYGDLTRTQKYSNLPCRWQPNVTRVLNAVGEELVSKIEVWILPTYTINEDYEIVKSSETYRVISKSDKYDLDGILDHVKLYLA